MGEHAGMFTSSCCESGRRFAGAEHGVGGRLVQPLRVATQAGEDSAIFSPESIARRRNGSPCAAVAAQSPSPVSPNARARRPRRRTAAPGNSPIEDRTKPDGRDCRRAISAGVRDRDVHRVGSWLRPHRAAPRPRWPGSSTQAPHEGHELIDAAAFGRHALERFRSSDSNGLTGSPPAPS